MMADSRTLDPDSPGTPSPTTSVDSAQATSSTDAWSALSEINEWIRFADSKATALLATGGVLGGLLVSRPAPKVHTVAGGFCLGAYVLTLVLITISVLCSLYALLPRLRVRGQPTSLLYFDHVARRFANSENAYLAALASTFADGVATAREVGGQIWSNSFVARTKFRRVTLATRLMGMAMLSGGAMGILLHI